MDSKQKIFSGNSALLAFGFFSLISLMAIVSFLGVRGMQSSSQNLAEIIDNNLHKMHLTTEMLRATSTRRDALNFISNTNDPLKREKALSQFAQAGADFTNARQNYLALGIDYQEIVIIEHQQEVTAGISPLQNKVIDLSLAGKQQQAHHLFMQQVAPAQQQVSASLTALQAIQQLKSDQYLAASVVKSGKSARLILSLSLVFLVLALLISGFVIRKNRINNRKLHSHIEEILAFNDALTNSQIQLHEAKEKAEEANKTKSQFLAKMSHELRTPLNAILGYSEMLKDEAKENGNTSTEQDLDKINGSARHLLMLINDVLDISKVEAGKMDLYLTEFAIGRMIEHVRFNIEPLMHRNSNSLKICYDSSIGSMFADELKCEQVLINLLSNSAKFTENGEIKLHLSRTRSIKGERIIIDVMDDGIGMSRDQVGHLFEAFVQADSSTASKYGGTGLGLAIIKHFIKMMQGEITVNSREGSGTHFRVDLPARVDRRIAESMHEEIKLVSGQKL